MFRHKALAAADRQGDPQQPINIDARPWTLSEVRGRVVAVDGRPLFVPETPARWLTALGRCVGQEVRVRLLKPKKRRTTEQNAYLWGVVYPDILAGLGQLAEIAGEPPVFTDEDELHEAMKWKFLRRLVTLPGGAVVERVPHSSVLDTAQFAAFLDSVIRWAADLGIYVRHAGEAISA